MSMLVVGSVAFDNVKTPFGKRRDVLGGSATYFSASASHFGPVNLLAVVGSDFPRKYIDFFKRRGINVEGLLVKEGRTFRWEGEYGWDFGDPRTISTNLNVFSDFDPVIPASYRDSQFLFLANIDPDLQRNVLMQMKRPKVVACDTMNYWIQNKKDKLKGLLKDIDIFFLNESEARELAGSGSVVKAAREILKLGPKRLVIKRGEHGSLLLSQREIFTVPAYLMESVIDPTGAGDTFAGGIMGYLASSGRITSHTLRRAVVYGSVMATFAVEDFSLGRLGSVTKRDIDKRFREFKRRTHFI